MKPLVEKLYNLHQSWYLEQLIKLGPRKLQVKVRRNAYDFQSWGTAEVWTPYAEGGKWEKVASIPGPMLRCLDSVSYVLSEERMRNEGGYAAMLEDAKALVNESKKILEG